MTFQKQPGEQYPIRINYFGKLPAGARILAATVSAEDVASPGVDASNAVLQSTTGTVDGPAVKVGVKGGEAGHSYKITVVAQLSTGEGDNLEDECVMVVEDE